MRDGGAVTVTPHPGNGIWIQCVIPDEAGTWYGYYHHEQPATVCGRPDRFILRIGAARSTDRGPTWEDLGVILEAPPDSIACASPHLYVLGGVGDVSAMQTPDRTDLFLFFSQYSKLPSEQRVTVARMGWADRDAPVGRLTIWVDHAWLPPRAVTGSTVEGATTWAYPAGTPFVPVSRPWHDDSADADAFWGTRFAPVRTRSCCG